MFDDLHVLVQTIETVLVGANPGIAVGAHHNTGHTGCTDDIVCAKLIAHVLESGGFAWLHKHSFLEQTQPDVAVRVFADAVNLGRALQILEKAGVITLGDYEGIPEIADIAENPKNINIQEIDGQSLPRSLQDVDAAVIQIGFAVAGGLDLDSDNIFKDTIDMSDPVQYQFVRMIDVRAEDVDNEVLKKVVAAYQSPEVAKVIEEVYKGTVEPAFTY